LIKIISGAEKYVSTSKDFLIEPWSNDEKRGGIKKLTLKNSNFERRLIPCQN